MKRILLFLIIPLLFACSSSDDDKVDNVDNYKSVVGTWTDGNYFVSFGNDGSYCAYLSDEFIDSGIFQQKDKTVSCSNTYFNRQTSYSISKISDSELIVNIEYIDIKGSDNNKTVTFSKSDKGTISNNNTLIGKSLEYPSQYFGNVIMSFNSFNAGIKSANTGIASKYPISFFYIFLNNELYYQILDNSIQVPSIGGWNVDYNKVKGLNLQFSSNGQISDFNSINL